MDKFKQRANPDTSVDLPVFKTQVQICKWYISLHVYSEIWNLMSYHGLENGFFDWLFLQQAFNNVNSIRLSFSQTVHVLLQPMWYDSSPVRCFSIFFISSLKPEATFKICFPPLALGFELRAPNLWGRRSTTPHPKYHSPPPCPFCSDYFGDRVLLFAGRGLDHGPSILCFCNYWDDRQGPLPRLFPLRWGLMVLWTFLPRLTWSLNLPDLSLPSRWDYRRGPLVSTYNF
jgi:hypothetical protein